MDVITMISQVQPTLFMEYTGYWIALGVMGLVVTFVVRQNMLKDKTIEKLMLSNQKCYSDKLSELKNSFARSVDVSLFEIKRKISEIHDYENETVKPKLIEFSNSLKQLIDKE